MILYDRELFASNRKDDRAELETILLVRQVGIYRRGKASIYSYQNTSY
jgi:hypothetical protein